MPAASNVRGNGSRFLDDTVIDRNKQLWSTLGLYNREIAIIMHNVDIIIWNELWISCTNESYVDEFQVDSE